MGRKPKYKINIAYFDKINTQNKAYILGFIYADGHVGKHSLNVCLQKRDIEILRFILKEFGSTHPLFTVVIKGRAYVGFNITRIKMVKTLREKYNLPTNKSINNLSLPNLDDNLMPHFIRGLFDGDGSVWFSGKKDVSFAFSGGESLMKEIQTLLFRLGINSSLRYRYEKENKFSCGLESKGSVKASKFFEYLYKGSKFSLKRKREKLFQAKQMAEKFIKRKNKQLLLHKDVIELYKNGVKQKAIHEKLKMPFSSVRNYVQRMRKIGVL